VSAGTISGGWVRTLLVWQSRHKAELGADLGDGRGAMDDDEVMAAVEMDNEGMSSRPGAKPAENIPWCTA
jgi:hypothetical protein